MASGDVDGTYATAQELAEPQNITLLEPSQAPNQNAFAVTEECAGQQPCHADRSRDLPPERSDQARRLAGVPGAPVLPGWAGRGLWGAGGESQALDAGGPLTVRDLLNGGIDVGRVFSSAGNVTSNDLVVLEDDQGLPLAENILPAVHTPSLTDTISDALYSVSAGLTTEELQAMNEQVDVQRMDPQDVATQFLTDNGLL